MKNMPIMCQFGFHNNGLNAPDAHGTNNARLSL